MKILSWALFSIVVAHAQALNHFSVSPKTMNAFVQKCVSVPSNEEMKAEINQMLQERQQKPNPNWKERFQSLFGKTLPTTANLKEVQLDGLKMTNLNPYDLEVISRLTMHNDASRSLWKDEYPVEQTQVNGAVKIQRKCLTSTCQSRKLEKPFDLTSFNSAPNCSDAGCAAQKIFGKEKGTKILWAYLKYGTNLSPYSDVNADSKGFDDGTLKAILAATAAVPEHLHAAAVRDSGFYRFKKGMTLAMYGDGGSTIANAAGAVFDSIDEFSFSEKVYIFTHELGHRAAYQDNDDLDDSEEWHKATGWKVRSDKSTSNKSQKGWVSGYSKTNPREDFAEVYSLYRFDPRRLKKISPERYQFMKEKVFRGIEYDQDLCKGTGELTPAPESEPTSTTTSTTTTTLRAPPAAPTNSPSPRPWRGAR